MQTCFYYILWKQNLFFMMIKKNVTNQQLMTGNCSTYVFACGLIFKLYTTHTLSGWINIGLQNFVYLHSTTFLVVYFYSWKCHKSSEGFNGQITLCLHWYLSFLCCLLTNIVKHISILSASASHTDITLHFKAINIFIVILTIMIICKRGFYLKYFKVHSTEMQYIIINTVIYLHTATYHTSLLLWTQRTQDDNYDALPFPLVPLVCHQHRIAIRLGHQFRHVCCCMAFQVWIFTTWNAPLSRLSIF